MDKNLQQWILNGAEAPTPPEYDIEFIRQLCCKHQINVVFYLGDLSDKVLEETKTFTRKLVYLDNNLNVHVTLKDKDDESIKDFYYIYAQVQGEKQVNFINYCDAQETNMKYIMNELWKKCFDGSVVILKNARKFLNDSEKSLKDLKDLFNSFKNKEYYDARVEFDQIIIEKV